jgi:LuxR family maltose regulon positive regulatory protein
MLEHLERNNLFVVPLDDDRCWYRYHHLFADLLRQRLERESQESVSALHHRASEWSQKQDVIVEAIQHAISSGDYHRSGHLVQQLGWSIFARGELTTVLGWIAALPEDIVRTHPELHVLQAWAMAKSGRLDRVEDCLRFVNEPDLRGEVAAVRAYVAGVRGDLAQAVELAQLALDLLPQGNAGLRAIITQNLGTAYHWSGDPLAASNCLVEAVELSKAAGQTHQSLTALAILGRAYEMQGALRLAIESYREALDLASHPDERPIPFAGMAYVGLAGPLYERDNLEEAKRCALEGLRLSELGGFVAYQVAGAARLAEITQAQGDLDRAWAALQQADGLATHRDYGLARAFVDQVRVKLWIARGDLAAASRWAQDHRISLDSTIDAAREVEQMAVARVLVTEKRRGEAWDLLGRLLRAARDAGRTGQQIRLLVLQALALQGGNGRCSELSVLEEALDLGEPEGYVRTFVDEGEPMRELLRKALSREVKSNYVARLLGALDDGIKPGSAATASLIEPLTEREMDVLRRIVAGLSNPEIAEELYIATSTVKSHVNHIYGKLGVAHRTEAVVRAYELDLL